MPYLKLQTNAETSVDTEQALMKKLSQEVARQLGKPERYVMIAIEPATSMLFAGDDTPLAYVELKGIGLQENLTNAPRQMWGWDKGTF